MEQFFLKSLKKNPYYASHKKQNKCVINNSKTMNRLYLMTCEWDLQQEDKLPPRSCSPQLAYLPATHTNPQGGPAVFPGQSYSHKYSGQLKKAGWDFSVFTRKIAEGLPRNLWMWRQQISFLQDRFKKKSPELTQGEFALGHSSSG